MKIARLTTYAARIAAATIPARAAPAIGQL
jgi:hypothetical protein